MKRPSHCLSLPILACLTAGLVESPAFSTGLVDRRASIEIEARTTISPADSGLNLKRAMLSMERHPDGSILVCPQTVPVLFRSTNLGKSWTRIDVRLSDALPKQVFHGIGISRDGRVWLMHQSIGGRDLFVSVSRERSGAQLSWDTAQIDYTRLAPNPEDPYHFCFNDYNSFFQRPDSTMVLGVGLRYDNHDDYQQEDQSRPGFHETLIRSRDGGKTWGDPTEVHPHVAETSYAVDPHNPHRILAFTRKQRPLLRGEDAETVAREAGVTPDISWPWKGAILLESVDGGRSFKEVPDSYLGYYSHRGAMRWTENNVVVAVHTSRGHRSYNLVANVSLDGGRTWVDGTRSGTPAMNRAQDFMITPHPPGFSFTTPTVELSPNRFLTAHAQNSQTSLSLKGVFWRLKTPASEAIALGSERQLFVDDFLIESLDGARQTLNQPTKFEENPVIAGVAKGEARWEAGMRHSFASVLYDPENKLFKMWYSLWAGSGGDEETVLCFTSSDNGIDWQRTWLDLFQHEEWEKTNIVMPHSGIGSGVFEDHRESDPAKRYKMLHMWKDYKIYASYSADGLRWTQYNDGKPVFFQPPGHDSQMVAYWDEGLGKYVGIIRDRTGRISELRPRLVSDPAGRAGWRKVWDPKKNRSPENHSIRRVGQIESSDFVHWTNYRVIVGPDGEDPLNRDQFYNMEVMPYEELRIGLTTVFTYDPEVPRGAVQLTSSRDGRNWQRVGDRGVFLAPSTRVGDFDWGTIYPIQAPFVNGHEIWIYYVGHGVDHHHVPPPGVDGFPNGIGLAMLRLDGFVSVDAGEDGGTLTTKAFTFKGNRLLVNAAASGTLRVEILDSSGSPVSGHTKSDCDPISGDSLRHTVKWSRESGLTSLQGKPIKLRFHLKNAKLYSFFFESES